MSIFDKEVNARASGISAVTLGSAPIQDSDYTTDTKGRRVNRNDVKNVFKQVTPQQLQLPNR